MPNILELKYWPESNTHDGKFCWRLARADNKPAGFPKNKTIARIAEENRMKNIGIQIRARAMEDRCIFLLLSNSTPADKRKHFLLALEQYMRLIE